MATEQQLKIYCKCRYCERFGHPVSLRPTYVSRGRASSIYYALCVDDAGRTHFVASFFGFTALKKWAGENGVRVVKRARMARDWTGVDITHDLVLQGDTGRR